MDLMRGILVFFMTEPLFHYIAPPIRADTDDPVCICIYEYTVFCM